MVKLICMKLKFQSLGHDLAFRDTEGDDDRALEARMPPRQGPPTVVDTLVLRPVRCACKQIWV